MGWQAREVTLCTDVDCPLYPYREAYNAEYNRRKKEIVSNRELDRLTESAKVSIKGTKKNATVQTQPG